MVTTSMKGGVIGTRMRDSSLVPDPLEVERVALQVNVLDFKEKSF